MKWQIDKSWTLFLDRDGVINERIFGGYIRTIEEFVFKPRVLESLSKMSASFGRIIVVTNQQGIGKKIMTESNLSEIHNYMINEIGRAGGRIDAVYFASNLKGAEPDRRKPEAAMAMEAKLDFPEIDFQRSIMVGDTDSDIKFGQNCGMKTVLMRSEELISLQADAEVENLMQLKDLLV